MKKVGRTDGRTDRRTDRQTDGLNQSYSCLVAANNNMEFNSDKFEHVHYKAKNSEEPIPKYNSNNGTPIETTSHVRDLGITMSSNASFTDHISERITVLKLKIGWILRTFQTREVLPMLTLWKQLVLCDHDYCSQLWNPDRVGDI